MLHTLFTLALSSTISATPAKPATPAQTAVAWVEKLATSVRAASAQDFQGLVPLATELFAGDSRLSVTSELVHALRDHTTQSASVLTPK